MPIDADHATAHVHRSEHNSSGVGAGALVVVPLAGVLAMVAALIVANAVDHWWTLVLAMSFDLVAILCVMGTVMRMLGGDDD
jgi:hypothetical protein